MPKELVFLGPRKVGFREYEEPPLKDTEVRIKTLYSGISSGTELAIYRGQAPMFKRTIKDGLFADGEPIYQYPLVYGYEEYGEVIEIGKKVEEENKYKVGSFVAASYGHRETGVVDAFESIKESLNFYGLIEIPPPRKMPPSVKDKKLAKRMMAVSLGGLSYDGIVMSGIQAGESAVIFGQGQIGLCCTLSCKQIGVNPVIAVDVVDERLELAKEFGADYVFNPNKCNVAEEVRKKLKTRYALPGADVVFDASGSYKALKDAIRCGAPGYGKVIAIGFYKGPATELDLGEEFHHGLGASTIISVGPYARQLYRATAPGRKWDMKRVGMAYFRLTLGKEDLIDKLVSHTFKFEDALKAYEILDKHPENCLKMLLTFQE